jgi:hypothetical protein
MGREEFLSMDDVSICTPTISRIFSGICKQLYVFPSEGWRTKAPLFLPHRDEKMDKPTSFIIEMVFWFTNTRSKTHLGSFSVLAIFHRQIFSFVLLDIYILCVLFLVCGRSIRIRNMQLATWNICIMHIPLFSLFICSPKYNNLSDEDTMSRE